MKHGLQETRWSGWGRLLTTLVVLAASAGWAQAAVVQAGSRAALGAVVAEADWATLGPDGTAVASPAAVAPATVNGVGAYTVFEQGNTWLGNFAAGDHVLSMFDSTTGDFLDGPINITLDAPVSAVGTQVQTAVSFGLFSVDVFLYDAADLLLGSFLGIAGNSTGDGDGSALFVGFISDAADIARMEIIGAGPAAAINRVTVGDAMIVNPVPAPASLALVMLALGALVRSRPARG